MGDLLEIENLCVRFPIRKGIFARRTGWVDAVNGVSLSLAEGETLAVVGESGSGKSTLARAILKLNKPYSGTIRFDGRDISTIVSSADSKSYRRAVQVVFQDPLASLNPRHTVLDIVTEGMMVHGLCNAANRRDEAVRLLESVGLDSSALERYPHEFSGGQRQRISIARAIALKPRLLICDEAVSALDLSVRAQVLNLLVDLKKELSLSYLFITHDMGVVQHLADRVAVMHEGRLEEIGDAEAVLLSPKAAYTKYLMAAVPRIGTPLVD